MWVKNRYPKWNAGGKWSQGLKPAVPWWFNFDPHPNSSPMRHATASCLFGWAFRSMHALRRMTASCLSAWVPIWELGQVAKALSIRHSKAHVGGSLMEGVLLELCAIEANKIGWTVCHPARNHDSGHGLRIGKVEDVRLPCRRNLPIDSHFHLCNI